MEPITLLIKFDELPDDTKCTIATFIVMLSILVVLLILYILLLMSTLLYNFIRIERNTQYSRLHDTEV